MILFNKSIEQNILLFHYLNSKYKDKVLIKQNLLYLNNDVELNTINTKVFIRKFDQYLYYNLNNNLNYKLINELNFIKSTNKYNDNIFDLDEFTYNEKGFFPKGNVIIVYFSTQYIKNPLGILCNIIKHIELKKQYFTVKIDYIPYKNKIIYYILFRYSLNYNSNLSEIIDNIKNIIQMKNIENNTIMFPKIQSEFEKEFFCNYDIFSYSTMDIKYEGLSIYSPFYKFKGGITSSLNN